MRRPKTPASGQWAIWWTRRSGAQMRVAHGSLNAMLEELGACDGAVRKDGAVVGAVGTFELRKDTAA